MNVLRTARELMVEAGWDCATGEDGCIHFSTPVSRGDVEEESLDHVRLRCELTAVVSDPVFLARASTDTVGTVRITLRNGIACAERRCNIAELALALPHLAQLPPPDASRGLVVEDVAVGAFDVALGTLSPPVLLRLAASQNDVVDRARATYLLIANPRLRAGKAGWVGGPGLVVHSADCDTDRLRWELFECGQALSVLEEEAIARSYLQLFDFKTTQPRVSAVNVATP